MKRPGCLRAFAFVLLLLACGIAKGTEDAPEGPTLVQSTIERDEALLRYSGTFMPHRRNYLLLMSRASSIPQQPSSPAFDDEPFGEEIQNEEIKFQLSFKLPLLTGVFDDGTRFWFAYTQQSHWQAYNWDESSPFRETNFEPEFFLSQNLDWDIGPGKLDLVTLHLNHQSNGREEPFSRSWNRIKSSVTYSSSRWAFILTPWYRIPESESGDDNPDIDEYLGHGELNVLYNPEGTYTLGVKLLNNLRSSQNRTSIELSWSFPLTHSFKAYFQYYNGYGETLVDYNSRIQRFGIGVALNDWL